MTYFAGVDLGATAIRAALADDAGEVVAHVRRPTPQASGIAVTEAVLDAVREVCDDVGVVPPRLGGVGVGSVGPLDLTEGSVDDPANLPDAIDRIPLTGPLRELVDSDRVFLHNDAVAGVVGERFYADRSPDDMVYLTISSGIGAGVCVDGHVLSGWDGNAGEVGHVTVDPDGRMVCGCGRRGHWEAYCSGENVPAYARALYGDDPVETAVPVDSADFSAADVYDNAGDPFADRVLDAVARWNAFGVTTIVHAYAPLVVYVGGGVALNNPDLVLDPIRERIEDLVVTNVPEIRLTTLGDDVVVRGAIASALTGGTGDRSRL